jgi:hypothetical protein
MGEHDHMTDADPFASSRTIADGMGIPRLNRYEDVQLVGVSEDDESVVRGLGARRTKVGWWVTRSRDLDIDALEPFLPRYAHRGVVPLVVDLIPSTTWHASLANVLVKSCWDDLRAESAAEAGGCEECGVSSGLECHERWGYDGIHAVQRLLGFETLCGSCHETRHLGFASIRGRFDQVFGRLCVANRILPHEREYYYGVIVRRFRARSAMFWDLDLSMLAGRGLRLKKAVGHQGEGILAGAVGDRNVAFRLVETRFSVSAKGVTIE